MSDPQLPAITVLTEPAPSELRHLTDYGRMVCFERGGMKFTHRTAGIVMRDNQILLTRGVNDAFWYLPGGRVELGENAKGALARELREELGIDGAVGRLLWVVENFFAFESTTQHELGLYFLVAIPPGRWNLDGEFAGAPTGDNIVFRWVDVEEIEKVNLYPSFLRKALRALPAETTHIVHVDGAVDAGE